MTAAGWEIKTGDVLEVLRTMPDESVHMVCTSPPYWGLRDYGTAAWDGGDPACGHVERQARGDAGRPATMVPRGAGGAMVPSGSSLPVDTPMQYRSVCGRCGARRVDQQLGLEATPDCGLWALSPALREQTGLASCGVCYVCRMVAVFREVRRVMRSDATLFCNMGDGYQDKQLLMMPARLALALQADGWILRSEIIWHKPNPMPESVTDRPTKAHEQIFLLTKRGTYYYDQDAIREPAQDWGARDRSASKYTAPTDGSAPDSWLTNGDRSAGGRNARSVWTIATQPYSEAHFATFPEELPRRCILAGTSERGVCPACGAPWRRVVELTAEYAAVKAQQRAIHGPNYHMTHAGINAVKGPGSGTNPATLPPKNTTTGWDPACSHAAEPVPAVVLDPFAGSGTTLMVAVRHGRSAIGIELSPTFAAMARRRILADHGAVEPTNGHTPAEGVQARMVGV